MRIVGILLASFVGLHGAAAQVDWPEVAAHGEQSAGLSLTLSVPKDHFYQGEIVPATLFYKNTSTAPFHLWIGNYDRSGRIPDIRLAARDDHGAAVPDPLGWYFARGGMGGGLGNFKDLGEWSITLPANQWLRFDHPGVYTIAAWSNRVKPGAKMMGKPDASPLELASNAVQITIDPLPAEKAQEIIAQAHAALAAGLGLKHDAPYNKEVYEDITRRQKAASDAISTLRYLGTPEARAELRTVLAEPNSFEAAAGILATPNPVAEAALMLDEIRSGKIKMSTTTVWVYQSLKTSQLIPLTSATGPRPTDAEIAAYQASYAGATEAARKEILDTAKQGAAKSGSDDQDLIWTTFQTSPDDPEALAGVIQHQTELSPEHQQQLLQMYLNFTTSNPGNPMKADDFLPLIRREANAPHYNQDALKDLAKVRPDEAKTLIVQDVTSGDFHYLKNAQGYRTDSHALLCLPADPIPKLEKPLRDLFASGKEEEAAFNLTDRYGTPALLPDMLAAYQPKAARWECEIVSSALRFWIRCDPAVGVDGLEKAVQARQSTGCFAMVLHDVLADHWVPEAQPLVTKALDDTDNRVALAAAQLIAEHGDASDAESLLTALERMIGTPGGNAWQTRELTKSLLTNSRWTWTDEQKVQLQKIADHD